MSAFDAVDDILHPAVHPVRVCLDIAKNIFHAHGVSQDGKVIFSRKLRRAKLEAFFSTLEPCLIDIEACSTSHHRARVFTAMGHTVKLIPPACVKALRQKSEDPLVRSDQ